MASRTITLTAKGDPEAIARALSKPSKVYLVERGVYSDRTPISVHTTLEGAKAAYPGNEWSLNGLGVWDNDKDWDALLSILEFEISE
jgi:hypothetical protein